MSSTKKWKDESKMNVEKWQKCMNSKHEHRDHMCILCVVFFCLDHLIFNINNIYLRIIIIMDI